MQISELSQEIICRLIQLDPKSTFSISSNMINTNWANLKLEIQQNLDKQKSITKVYVILALILLSIIGISSSIVALDLSSWPDLNKGAMLIFLTVANTLTAFLQKLKVEKLEKQILLVEILSSIDEKIKTDNNS